MACPHGVEISKKVGCIECEAFKWRTPKPIPTIKGFAKNVAKSRAKSLIQPCPCCGEKLRVVQQWTEGKTRRIRVIVKA